MKRLIALSILAVGLIPSIPVFTADAIVPNQEDLQRHCRERLGFGQTEPVYGSLLLQLRRCIDNTREQYETASRLLRRSGAVHYSVITAENTESHHRITQRTLNTQMENAEQTRLSYYHNVPLEDREVLLQNQRTSRRLLVQEAEARLVRERRAKLDRYRRAIQTCRYYPATGSQECIQYELSR